MSVGIDESGMTCGDGVDPCTEERRQEGKEGGTGSIVVRMEIYVSSKRETPSTVTHLLAHMY